MTRHHIKKEPARVKTCSSVDGLNVQKLESRIEWRGMVRLHLLGEDDESMLANVEWPKASGRHYYGCASTGLLFDKETGRCLQSSQVTLVLDSVEAAKMSAYQFGKWRTERQTGCRQHIVISAKRGPKPKGYVPPDDDDGDY